MKKKIFISIGYLEIGGAEISLIGLLNSIDYTKYEVDLFVYSHRGELFRFIPKEVNILPEEKKYTFISAPMLYTLRHGCLDILYGRLKAKLYNRKFLFKNKLQDSFSGYQYMARCVSPFLPYMSNHHYDLAISFLQPHNFVIDKVNSNKKVCWIHTDYSKVHVNVDIELPVWAAFDNIVSISPAVTTSFLQIFPTLQSKIIEIENILSPYFVRQRAELISEEEVAKDMPNGENEVKLLSIGRFCEAKNYDNVPDICKKIVSRLKVQGSRFNIRWYIIGYGMDEQLIRKKISEAGMEDHVIMLGKKINPYPYIKACDFYIQPSRYEGKSVTVREAQMLCKPVVVTNYATAKSQIQNGVDGVIVPMDNEGCAQGITDFIQDTNQQNEIVNYLMAHDYGNMNEVNKLYQMI